MVAFQAVFLCPNIKITLAIKAVTIIKATTEELNKHTLPETRPVISL